MELQVKSLYSLIALGMASLCSLTSVNVVGQDVTVASASLNQLTSEEQKAGWKLLFDGKSFDGWHNYKSDKVSDGWEDR